VQIMHASNSRSLCFEAILVGAAIRAARWI
jgi:hypothetical protein